MKLLCCSIFIEWNLKYSVSKICSAFVKGYLEYVIIWNIRKDFHYALFKVFVKYIGNEHIGVIDSASKFKVFVLLIIIWILIVSNVVFCHIYIPIVMRQNTFSSYFNWLTLFVSLYLICFPMLFPIGFKICCVRFVSFLIGLLFCIPFTAVFFVVDCFSQTNLSMAYSRFF